MTWQQTSVALFGDLAATAELTSGVSKETKTCVTPHLMEMARCLEELQHVPTELACFTATCQRWGSDLVDAGCKVMIGEASRANYGKAVLMFRREKGFTEMQISLPGRSLQQCPLSYRARQLNCSGRHST